MDLKLIKDLNESQMYRSKQAIQRVNARQVADHAFMDLIALWILYNEFEFAPNAMAMAGKTAQYNGFKNYRQNGTDLYMNLHIISENRQDLLDSTADGVLLDRIMLDSNMVVRHLRRLASNSQSESQVRMTLQQLERSLQIENSNYRSVRRLAQSWPELNTGQKRLAITRMLMFYRTQARRSEMFGMLEALARSKNLEASSATNPERNIAATAAAAAAAGYAAYHVGHRIGKALV